MKPTQDEMAIIDCKWTAAVAVLGYNEAIRRLGMEYRDEEGPTRRAIWMAFQTSDRARVDGGRLVDGVFSVDPAHVEAVEKYTKLYAETGSPPAPAPARPL